MADKYLTVEEVASITGLTNSEVIQNTTSGKLRGFRDGSTWKYRQDCVDTFIKDRRRQMEAESEDEDDYGYSESITTMPEDEDPIYDAVPVAENSQSGRSEDSQAISSDISLNLSVDEEASLDTDSGVNLGDGFDDDLVLGDGSGIGSGITLGQDSGILLVGSGDSGIALDEDIEETLELGDDELGLEPSSSNIGESDFRLSPHEDDSDVLDDSGSQVIPLDDTESMEMDANLFDDQADSNNPFDGVTEAGPAVPMMDPAVQLAILESKLPEKPYSIWNILGLFFCILVLTFCLLFVSDLIRFMWSWGQPTQLNSAIMDWIIEQFAPAS